ncbi:MAG TPA: dodecin family protein [Xanthomonadales bacterium]|nr:dodecin family protein [Xanthomonadales bacterium]
MAVAKVIEITSGSTTSFDDALRQGIARAHDTVANVTGAWIKDQSVRVSNGKITEYRVEMKVTFLLEPRGKSGKKK